MDHNNQDRRTTTIRINQIFWSSKTSPKSKWSQIPCNSMVIRRVITLKTVNYCTKCCDSTINWLGRCWMQRDLPQLSHMSGTSYGAHRAARAIFMKGWMSTRKSIISHRVMRLPGKTDFASILFECKKDLESSILTSYQIPTSSPMNLVSSTSTTKNWNSMIARRIFG